MWEALAREWNKLESLGRGISAERQENLVPGRLVLNVITGKDDAVQSARQLGADKRISMWQPNSQVGLVVLQAPDVRKIKHHVPLVPSKHAEEFEGAMSFEAMGFHFIEALNAQFDAEQNGRPVAMSTGHVANSLIVIF